MGRRRESGERRRIWERESEEGKGKEGKGREGKGKEGRERMEGREREKRGKTEKGRKKREVRRGEKGRKREKEGKGEKVMQREGKQSLVLLGLSAGPAGPALPRRSRAQHMAQRAGPGRDTAAPGAVSSYLFLPLQMSVNEAGAGGADLWARGGRSSAPSFYHAVVWLDLVTPKGPIQRYSCICLGGTMAAQFINCLSSCLRPLVLLFSPLLINFLGEFINTLE